MYIRVRSFLNAYDNALTLEQQIYRYNAKQEQEGLSKEETKQKAVKEQADADLAKLAQYEVAQETSYIFDDCTANLEETTGAKAIYQKLSKKMRSLFLKEVALQPAEFHLIDQLMDIGELMDELGRVLET